MDYYLWLKVCDKSSGKIISAKEGYAEAVKLIKDFSKENFIGLYLNSKNKMIHSEVISIGTLNSSLIHPREVFKPAFIHSANSIILVHNHPSGDTEPSSEDNEVTDIIKKAGELLQISLLDHIIIGNNTWYSYQEDFKL